jgi:hypothetical protein
VISYREYRRKNFRRYLAQGACMGAVVWFGILGIFLAASRMPPSMFLSDIPSLLAIPVIYLLFTVWLTLALTKSRWRRECSYEQFESLRHAGDKGAENSD